MSITTSTVSPITPETRRPEGTVLHLPSASATAPPVAVPAGKRVPFAWPSLAVAPDIATTLHWSLDALPEGNVWLRLAVALDVRETVAVEVRRPSTQAVLGILDFTQSPVFQIHELPLTRDDAWRALAEGLELVLTSGTVALRVFAPTKSSALPVLLQPHLLVTTPGVDRWARFHERMLGFDTVQPFGWMEGALLDGLQDLDAAFPELNLGPVIESRIGLYVSGTDLTYENPTSTPMLNKIYGIEGTLPFSVIARRMPDHPHVQTAVDFWHGHTGDSGAVMEGAFINSEGSYTVAWPMMIVARQRGDADLKSLALTQLRLRRDLLTDASGNIHQQINGGRLGNRNWARGIAWYFLGLIRTLIEAGPRDDVQDLEDEALRVMEFVLRHQRDEDGLWQNFIHDSAHEVDTSGSAGIAAALALGAAHGLLPEQDRMAAVRTLAGLHDRLTPDGLLTFGTPSNRATVIYDQRRVIYPVGMGLTAQLIAALDLP